MSWNEPEWAQILKKFVPVMHTSVRHDVFYNFSSRVTNVENKDKKPFFIVHFHKVLRPRPLTPFDLRLTFCSKWKVLQSYITLEDSSFGSNFREVLVAYIVNLFWVVFYGILHQMSPNLYKSFTSDATKLSQKKWISDSKSFSVYTLMKIHNRCKFHQYNICGCWVKNFQSFAYRFSIH